MKSTAIALLGLLAAGPCLAAGNPPLLLQQPSLSRNEIAFAHGGQIWVVPREGGAARRVVSGATRAGHPVFSPDGATIAYTGVYDGNADVYVVPASGGEPRRLTFHPDADVALGFTPDGASVLFRSKRASPRDLSHLYTVPVAGGSPVRLPLPSGDQAAYSPDGSHLAYVPIPQWQPEWKKYRGGQTTPIWIADLADSSVVKVPRDGSNDRNPIWVGETVYFLSDRAGPFALFAYDTKSRTVREVARSADGFDLKSAQAGPGGIVLDAFGSLQLLDLSTGAVRRVPVTIAADQPEVRPRLAKIEPSEVLHEAISPTGKRVVLEAHGELLSVPAEKGDARNLTRSPGVADRDPAFSPDGKWVASFSDESGEYALHLRAPDGLGAVRKIDLGTPPSFFYGPVWSPDSKKIAFTDKRLNLWLVDLDRPAPVKIDTDLFDTPLSSLDPSWSPDSRWLAYTKQLRSYLHAAFVYSLEEKRSHQVTDGLSDAIGARFDAGGKTLYFAASTDTALAQGWLDMTSLSRPVTRSVYAIVLRKDLPSPVAPESDEEEAAKAPEPVKEKGKAKEKGEKGDKSDKGKADADEADKPKVEPVRIDLAGLDQRIVALPIEPANYVALAAGKEGCLYLLSAPVVQTDLSSDGPPPLTLSRFELKTRKTEKLAEGVERFQLSADGAKMLLKQEKKWTVADADKAPKAGEGALKLDALAVHVDPRAEWRQMYREVWRIERDFLYDPGFHGLDLKAAEALYAAFLPGISSREDLNDLFREMTGHLVIGHTFVGGGTEPKEEKVAVGLLGADYDVVDGRYRIARVLRGENWNPKLHAPLTEPGVNVAEGDFLLAVNGQSVDASSDVHRFLVGTAGHQTVLTVGPKADGTGSRNVTVVPVPSETGLRLREWIEGNRRTVDRLSNGRVGYVYIPDTGGDGFAAFNRYFFAHVGKEAVVLDERFNHGGNIADYVVETLARTPQMLVAGREGSDYVEPAEAIYGPKVMLVNEMSGSGGDALPWLFRKAKLGPLVGTRTWGGLVGISGYPPLVDGGGVTAPRWAIYGTEGEWEVENRGIAPDVVVEQDPALTRKGHDPQLEKAVEIVLGELAKKPAPTFKRPAAPNYGQKLGRLEP